VVALEVPRCHPSENLGHGSRSTSEITNERAGTLLRVHIERDDVADRQDDRDETFLDEVSERLGFRAFFAKHPALDTGYRIAIGVLGAAIMVLGFVLIPLPGPGWLIVFAGLALLATEFAWAERLLRFGRRKLHTWTQWVTRQSLAVRFLIGLVGLAFAATVLWFSLRTLGLSDQLPLV
jgi:uncharacterized protein (TIGR02611 family)